MLRLATLADLPRILEIGGDPGDAPLSDPRAVISAAAARLIDDGALWVWHERAGAVAGFAGIDAREGAIWALLVAPGYDGRGIGRALLAAACNALRAAGHRAATLRLAPESAAERHYRAAGWTVAGDSAEGLLILRKGL